MSMQTAIQILEGIDRLLAEEGYKADSSVRHQLAIAMSVISKECAGIVNDVQEIRKILRVNGIRC